MQQSANNLYMQQSVNNLRSLLKTNIVSAPMQIPEIFKIIQYAK